MSGDYDVAIVGAGPAGGNAALAAAQHGLRVLLLDEQPAAGGQVWRAKSSAILAAPATEESTAGTSLRNRLAQSCVTHLRGARVWQMSQDGGWKLEVLQGGSSETYTAKKLVLATGAREYVQPVPGWTTPGVIGLAGATALFKQNLRAPGQRTMVCGTGPLVFYVASEIRRLGGTVAAVITPNARMDWARATPALLRRPALLARGALWVADLKLAGVPIYWQHAVTGVDGDTEVTAVEFAPLSHDWTPEASREVIHADSLCLGNGLIPQIEAAQMLGVPLTHDAQLGGWVPRAAPDGVTDIAGLYLCGDGAGIRGAEAAVHQGTLTGLRIAADMGFDTSTARDSTRALWVRAARFGRAMTALSIPRAGLAQLSTDDTVVCRCEGITKAGITQETTHGAGSCNAVKSGLRAGMGPCGGKFCQTAVAQIICTETGQDVAHVAPPTARPPLCPVPLDAAAGAFDYDALPIPKPAPL